MMLHKFDIIFDLNASFCVTFEYSNQAVFAESNIKKYLEKLYENHLHGNGFSSRFEHPIFKKFFVGRTETYPGSRLFDIEKRLLEFDFEGRLQMNRIINELAQNDYKIPKGPDDVSAGFQELKPLPKQLRVITGERGTKTTANRYATYGLQERTNEMLRTISPRIVRAVGRPTGRERPTEPHLVH